MNDKDTVAADAAAPTHADDTAVDEFAAAMKEKLAKARAKGRGGWEQCDTTDLSIMLREHVEKGDPLDVANFCMMLWHHTASISDAALPWGKRANEKAAAQPDESAAFDLPPLPAPLEIDWPELHSHALGCGVEDRNILDRYEAAEYGWLDGADKAAERVPEEIFTADQMREYALAAVARATAPQAQPDERAAPTDSIPLHEDMLRALEHVECVYRQNVVKDGEPSSTLANLQRVIARARATAPQATMPLLTDAMRAVLRNENCIYGSEDDLYTALCAAADVEQRTNDDAISFIKDISTQKPEKPDYWSACGQCEHNIERAQEILESQGGT